MARNESATAEVNRKVDLRPYVPVLVQEWRPDPAVAGEFLEIEGTLLSADLSGFTALSEKLTALGREGAEELTNLLNSCFEGMIEAMDARGGDVLKFGGDALLVLFVGPDHARRACAAAMATRKVVRTPLRATAGTIVQLRISQGLHSGTFQLFAVRGSHIEVLISGPGATETVTCEAEAAAGEVLLSPACATLLDPSWIGAEKAGRWLLRQGQSAAAYETSSSLTHMQGPGTGAFRAATSTGTGADDVSPFVPKVQQDQIAAGGAGEHRRATVGFLKFSHTDRLVTEQGPAALAARLAELSQAVARAEEKHGVHWLATDIYPDGGKFILTAGAPVSTGHDEEAMLGAMRDVLGGGIDLDLSAGANAGPVFVGDVGSSERHTFTVMGDAVNLAARLMQKANKGELVASEAVYQMTRTPFDLKRMAPFTVKGKLRPVQAAIVGQRSETTSQNGTRFPLVGRDDEFTKLLGLVEDARNGVGSVIDILGDAGMGKTRIVDELRAAPDVRTIGIICGRYAQTSPYFASRLVLRTIAGIQPGASRNDAGSALTQFVARNAPELAPWLPLLATPFDADVPPTRESSLVAPVHRRARTHQFVGELLTAAIRGITALIVDDAHWIDDASRDLLETLAGIGPERGWILCISRRPGAQEFFGESIQCHRIELQPLSTEASLALAFEVGGDEAALPPDEWDRIAHHASGNPLFVIELVLSAAGNETTALPQTVESIVTSRIDTLSASDRLLLRDASVLGMVVDLNLLADALEDDAFRAVGRWAALEPFLAPMGPAQLAFRQELYHQTAYEGLPYTRRRLIHRRVGTALEQRLTGEEGAELLSVHFSRAGDHQRAWRYSIEAANRAREAYANVESAALYRRALESSRSLAHLDPAEIVSALESLGDVSELGARYDDAARAYSEARRRLSSAIVAGTVPNLSAARLCRKSGAVDERLGRYSQALRWYGKGLKLTADTSLDGESGSPRAQLKLAYAGVRYRQGRYRDMLRWANEAADEARASADRATLGHAYFLLDLAYTFVGASERGSYARQALEIFQQLEDYVGISRSLNNLGISAWRSGDWSESLDLFQRSRVAYERSGDVVGAAMAASNVAETLSDQGRLEEAIEILRDALRTCRSARYPSGAAVITGNLGQAEARAGRFDQGLTLLDESIDLLKSLGAAGYELEAAVKKKEALALAGHFDKVLDDSRELLIRLDASEEEVLGAALQRHRALALRGVGRIEDAVRAIDDSIARAEAATAEYELGRSLLVRADFASRNRDDQIADRERGTMLLLHLGVAAPNERLSHVSGGPQA